MMNNKELALLGLLSENPKYGYQVESDIEARGMREWTEIGFSSIYYLLNKAEKLNWVTAGKEDSGEGPSRKVYGLTAEGVKVLRSAVTQRLENPNPNSGDFQLALAFLPVLSQKEINQSLAEYRLRLEQDLAHVQSRYQEQSPLPPHVAILFEYNLHRIQAELTWVNDYLEQRKATPDDKTGL